MQKQKDKNVLEKAANLAIEGMAVRRYRAWLFQGMLVFVAGAFAVLTFLVKTTPAFEIDFQITQAVQSINFPFFAGWMNLVSWPGFSPQAMIIAGLLVLLMYGLGLRWEAFTTCIAAVFPMLINLLLKNLIQRPRPAPGMVNVVDLLDSYSFPSGHVMFYLGCFGFAAFLVFSLLKPSLTRSLLLGLLGLPIALIGVSRIYLGDHWASDVLGSYLLGSLVLAATIQFYRWGKTRFFVHQPIVAPET